MSSEQHQKPKKRWTKKQLRASQGLLTQQAKTNIYANQAGMTCPGAVRHGADIRADDANQEGQAILTQQAATNIYANQSGMTSFGAVRHGKDIAVKELYEEDDGEYPTDEEDEVVQKPARKSRAADPAPEEQEAGGDE